jgi:hypothetical protein
MRDARIGLNSVGVRVLGALAALCVGCHSGSEEAARVVAAMDDYRAAVGDPAILTAAQRLQAVACTRADVCYAKAACVDVARPSAAAIELKLDVERQLGEVAPSQAPANAAALTAKLDEAKVLLEAARAAAPQCVRQGLALSERYGLTLGVGGPR